MIHQSHPKITARLKRANGHLAAILTMFEDGRSCVELAQQLHAVESAVANAKRQLIHDHIEHCLQEEAEDSGSSGALAELKLLTKYL